MKKKQISCVVEKGKMKFLYVLGRGTRQMKKIGIITIDSMNFGNKLQNYALQEVVKSFGYLVETIQRALPAQGKQRIINDSKKIGQFFWGTKGAKFNLFNRRIKRSNCYALANEAQVELANEYDYFIAGSDQVWNPHYTFVGKSDLLVFAKPEQRISYAASFGVDEIPEEKKDIYTENLRQFKTLSVREKKGAEMIKELTGKEAQVVLDPTMLLTSEQWMKVEKKCRFTPKRKYALIYSLGEKSTEFEYAINYYRKRFDVFDIRAIQKNGREIPVGPAEFLYLIHHAEIILTDSFHASVFSILYHKKFKSFKRPGNDMSSRIVSLANAIGAVEHLDSDNNLDCSRSLDYIVVDQLIDNERKKSIDYLKKALME